MVSNAREKVPFSIYDTITVKDSETHGRLFVRGGGDRSPDKDFGAGFLQSDQTAQIERLVLEVRTANVLDLGVLRMGLNFDFIVGDRIYPVLPPLLDKIGPDGVARYDYFCDPQYIDFDEKALIAEMEKDAKTSPKAQAFFDKYVHRSANPVCIAARQGFRVHYSANAEAFKVLCHPETIARVYLVGTAVRDIK